MQRPLQVTTTTCIWRQLTYESGIELQKHLSTKTEAHIAFAKKTCLMIRLTELFPIKQQKNKNINKQK